MQDELRTKAILRACREQAEQFRGSDFHVAFVRAMCPGRLSLLLAGEISEDDASGEFDMHLEPLPDTLTSKRALERLPAPSCFCSEADIVYIGDLSRATSYQHLSNLGMLSLNGLWRPLETYAGGRRLALVLKHVRSMIESSEWCDVKLLWSLIVEGVLTDLGKNLPLFTQPWIWSQTDSFLGLKPTATATNWETLKELSNQTFRPGWSISFSNDMFTCSIFVVDLLFDLISSHPPIQQASSPAKSQVADSENMGEESRLDRRFRKAKEMLARISADSSRGTITLDGIQYHATEQEAAFVHAVITAEGETISFARMKQECQILARANSSWLCNGLPDPVRRLIKGENNGYRLRIDGP